MSKFKADIGKDGLKMEFDAPDETSDKVAESANSVIKTFFIRVTGIILAVAITKKPAMLKSLAKSFTKNLIKM